MQKTSPTKKLERGSPVVRFTYERFSDLLIAKELIGDNLQGEALKTLNPTHAFGKKLQDEFFNLKGVLEPLSILFAEKYQIELFDHLPDPYDFEHFGVHEIFIESVLWRSNEAFTDRTRKLLNLLPSQYPEDRALEILLKLATERDHPWNADFLHEALNNLPMPQRDASWSAYLALNDYEEDQGYSESIVRTLIDWAAFGELSGVDRETKRLCAVTLVWFLTTSNQRVRDQATKSLVRLLSTESSLVPALLEQFHQVDDPYLVERLYAVAYGVVCNIENSDLIGQIALKTFDLVFQDGKPIPHILLRDYARGVLEVGLEAAVLPPSITTEQFRPPYSSEWPLENPSKAELDTLDGDSYSGIKSSLMGFPGDFGNYAMSRIHDWSPTRLTEPKPETGLELKVKFAEQLEDGIKTLFLKSIVPTKSKTKAGKFDVEMPKITVNIVDGKKSKAELKAISLNQEISNSLNDEGQEYFRWLSGLQDDRTAAFSRKWAQRWVCKRAYDLGWTADLFAEFESNCSRDRGRESRRDSVERIGKKYQWIGFHEFLARLSDNVHWIDRGYSDLDDKEYYGPWQMHERDIDPTIWSRKSREAAGYYDKVTAWWQPFEFPFGGLSDIASQTEFMWSEERVPNFPDLLQIENPKSGERWTVLKGFWNQRQLGDDESKPMLDGWFRVNSVVVKLEDYDELKKSIVGKNLIDPHTVTLNSSHYQGYYGEYPWHPYYSNFESWQEPSHSVWDVVPVRHMMPICEYEWEVSGHDFSLEESHQIYMPDIEVIKGLGLRRSNESLGSWVDADGTVAFCNPCLDEEGPSYALIRTDIYDKWLADKGYVHVWLTGGEKGLIGQHSNRFHGQHVFNGIFTAKAGVVSGQTWFKREEPH